LPSGATSTPIGPLMSLTRIVRLKFDHTVPEQSDLRPFPATQATPPTMWRTSSDPAVYASPKWPMPVIQTRPSSYSRGVAVPSFTAAPS
jgi:hypothetical protein